MKKNNLMLVLTLAVLAWGLGSCAQATTTTPATTTVTAQVLTLSWTNTDATSATYAHASFGVYPLTGKTITDVTFTYGLNSVFVAGSSGGDWQYKNTGGSDTWVKSLTWATDIQGANLWNVVSSSAATVPSATDNVSLKMWANKDGATVIYLKQAVLTYSDSTTETLTFVSDGSAPVKSVVGSNTTYVTLASRFWTYNDAFTMTTGYVAAPF